MNARSALVILSLLVMSCVPTTGERYSSDRGGYSGRSQVQDLHWACQAGNRRACVALGAAIERQQDARRDFWDRRDPWDRHDRWNRRDRDWNRHTRDDRFMPAPPVRRDNSPPNPGLAAERRRDAERNRTMDRNDRDNPFLNDPRFQRNDDPRNPGAAAQQRQGGGNDRDNPFLNDPRFSGPAQ
ncbi:hypothetical protein JL101_000395 [Skermanella rosea]|uniref:hypothetical protein n=1 Tax=Skermanella rosea TaxID=1817965 RepID=UPI0019313CE4|nr:hypothetical protein [Skermanella rosea]UEM03943.1 hypothetical protein JL101_000395 [Skermanella rosea]